MRYATDPSTDILMLGWKEIGQGYVQLWLPGDNKPYWLLDGIPTHLFAFNAEFELMIWNKVGMPKYSFPTWTIQHMTCIAALANRYGFPNTLEDVCKALETKNQKNPEGKVLIQLFCTPKYGWPAHNDGRWQRFIKYCKEDCLAEEDVLRSLPSMELNDEERGTWEHTVEMNLAGVPVDVESSKQIRIVSEQYREAHYELLPELTGNRITKITQTKRIKDYCTDRGFEMADCTAHTVSEMLNLDLPDDIMQLLEMRAQIGLSSIGKYIRFEEMSKNGRIYFNQRYYGAHTGRWTGSGVQLFNLPRKQIQDKNAEDDFESGKIMVQEYARRLNQASETEIQRYFTGDIVNDNPIKSARALIRAMVKAEDGKMLVWSDWSSIEYVLIEWFAGNTTALERFDQGFDQYIDQAATMYSRPYEEIVKSQRQEGKVVVLGCGYGQGVNKLIVTADKQWGMKIDEQKASFLVSGYRKAHYLVVNMWYSMARACVEAVENPGRSVVSHKCAFKVVKDRVGNRWLTIRLPSGRNLFYFRPFLEMDTRGPVVCHYGWVQKYQMWSVQKMIPGRIVENIVQAASRCILVESLKVLRKQGHHVLWSTYDEIVMQCPKETAEADLVNLNNIMCKQLPWTEGLPLKSNGFVMRRYRKM